MDGLFSREEIGFQFLERYTGSPRVAFQPYILLANSQIYVEQFAANDQLPIYQGSSMSVCHNPHTQISLINFGIGSPVAALIAELLSFLRPQATLLLGLCGGLRDNYQIGDYFNPVAAIREEGTSNCFIPARCPSLSSFVIQRKVCQVLEQHQKSYHTGVIHTTNIRFWEFKDSFKEQLYEERSQAIDMECATLFSVGFAYNVAIGALMLVTDLPLQPNGVKTIKSAKEVMTKCLAQHVQLGVEVIQQLKQAEQGLHYQF